jgi:hypothetical protein
MVSINLTKSVLAVFSPFVENEVAKISPVHKFRAGWALLAGEKYVVAL